MPKVEIGCRDCRKCTNSAVGNLGRNTGRVSAAVMTGGMSEFGFAFTKKCRTCGHPMSLHGYTATPQPTVNVQAPPSAPIFAAQVPAPVASIGAAQVPAPATTVGVADEIKKLAELRDGGVLNEEEFQAQKGKLLGTTAAVPPPASAFDVILVSCGDQKIRVIKVIMTFTSLGLREAKDLVDRAPSRILTQVTQEQAERAKSQFEKAGAFVDLR